MDRPPLHRVKVHDLGVFIDADLTMRTHVEQSARRCHVRTLSADVQTPLKEIFVLSLLQHYLILLVCYSDSVVILAVAFAA